MATLNLRNPNGYDGSPATQYKQGIMRFATLEEASAGTANNVAISPATAQAATALDFASPPVLGFGSTTPRPVHATTLSALGAVTINTSGSAATTIGTGGTGAVNIGNATGNTAVTGSLTASTTLTATLGNITATNGNLVLSAAGNKLVIHATTAASDSVGTTDAMTAGEVTITSSAITASSKIIFSRRTTGGTTGDVAISAQANGSATLTSSSNTETSTFDYLIIN